MEAWEASFRNAWQSWEIMTAISYPGISIDVLNSPEQMFTEIEEQDANLSRGDIYAVAFFPTGDLTYHDDLYFKMKFIDFAYKVRYAIFAVLAVSTIGAVILMVSLIRTAGKKG